MNDAGRTRRAETIAAVRQAASRLGATDVQVSAAAGNRLRVESRSMGWDVQELSVGDRRYRLFEFTSDVTPVHRDDRLPVVAIDEAGHTYLLNEQRQLADFLARALVSRPRSVWRLAQVVASLIGGVNEHVIRGPADVTAEGRRALIDSGVTPSAPAIRTDEVAGAVLTFISVAVAPGLVKGRLAADFYRWTVRALPDGTADWQRRPVSLGVPGAVRI